MSAPIVLVDLSPWNTPHRVRGIGRYVRDLARGLALATKERDDVRVLGVSWIDALGRATIVDDLSQLRDEVRDDELRDVEAKVRWARRVHLARVAKHVGASFVHLPDARGTPLGSIARIVTCHDLIPLRFADRYLNWQDGGVSVRRARDARRYRGAAKVIAISQETRRDLIALLDVDASRIAVVHNGIDLSRWTPDPSESGREVVVRRGLGEHPYLLYVGSMEWRKNPENMLSAIAIASRSKRIDLAWAGVLSDDERARVLAMAKERGVERQLHLLGFVDDGELAVLYRRSLAHLLVSRAEGFGLTIVEAMACGAPVIATAGSSLAEVAGEAAMLVDAEDARAIADASLRLVEDRALRVDLRARGVERALKFSNVAMGRETIDVYARVDASTRVQ